VVHAFSCSPLPVTDNIEANHSRAGKRDIMARVQIRPLTSHGEYRQCERIQKAVWGRHSVSSEVLSVTQKYGGAVLGAIVRRQVVGFIYAFLARRRGRMVHWSHMMAVEARYRDLGLGFRMKVVHRELALEQGLAAICWTYDPLQSRNATLNIARLGGWTEEYIPDCYGHFPSVIEKGLPSDRFVLEWHVGWAAVGRRLSRNARGPNYRSTALLQQLLALPRVNETRLDSGGFVENRSIRLYLRKHRLLVEIPSNTDAMREQRLPLARRWRMEARTIFTRYLAAGYRVDEFIPPYPEAGGRCFYVLRRAERH
jgi:predicted GNAT superfamily acetyltransferase